MGHVASNGKAGHNHVLLTLGLSITFSGGSLIDEIAVDIESYM